MSTTTTSKVHRKMYAAALCAAFVIACASTRSSSAAEPAGNAPAPADPAAQKTYDSPEAAFAALIDAMAKNSDDAVLDVLGHQHTDLVVQTDKEASAEVRKKICAAAKENLRIVTTGDKASAHLGLKDWPYPIPLVKKANSWSFDTAAGKEEILNRRIGRNELHAIRFVNAYDDAQRAYATKDHTGDKVLKYAQKLISSKDKKDGLYWPIAVDSKEEPSPLDAAFEEGQDFRDGADVPYSGYFFKVLTKQGANPPNGKYDYVINGNMIAGFALVAYPADYGTSGIMTFVINHQGVIYQKDLGPDSSKLGAAMDEYNPDATWTAVKPEDR